MSNISFILCAKAFKESMTQVVEGVQFHKKIGDEFLLVTNDIETSSFSPSFLKHFDQILFSKISGCGESRRIGVEAASCDLVAFVDDDTLLLENWRVEAERFLEIPSVAFFHAQGAGGIETMLDSELFNTFIFYTDTAGSVFRRAVVLAAGNFDPEMARSEDTDMATKIFCQGLDAAVGSVAIRNLERPTIVTIGGRFFSTLKPEAKIFLRAGFRLKVRNVFQIPIMLTKMGHRFWSLSFYQLWIRFFLVFRTQNSGADGMYIRKKRQVKVLVAMNDDLYLLSDSVRIVFGVEKIRFIHLDSTRSFYAQMGETEVKFNSNLMTISILDSSSDLKSEMLSAGVIRPV
jgi:hypothetical protein